MFPPGGPLRSPAAQLCTQEVRLGNPRPSAQALWSCALRATQSHAFVRSFVRSLTYLSLSLQPKIHVLGDSPPRVSRPRYGSRYIRV